MRLPSLEKVVSTLIDNIWDMITVVIAIVIIANYFSTPLPPSLEPIGNLIIGVFTILGLLAVSGLWERWRRLNRIESIVRSIQFQISILTHRPVANRFFYSSKQEVINATSEITQSPVNVIWFSGITLRGTVKAHQNYIEDLLRQGKRVRIMLVASELDDLMDELTRRSGAGNREYWRNCITNTQQIIEDIGNTCKGTGCLELGQLPFMPSFGIVMANPEQENGQAIVEIYHHDRAPLNSTFKLSAEDDPFWFTDFRHQYEILWSKCKAKRILG